VPRAHKGWRSKTSFDGDLEALQLGSLGMLLEEQAPAPLGACARRLAEKALVEDMLTQAKQGPGLGRVG
jgi:hypothetical protein